MLQEKEIAKHDLRSYSYSPVDFLLAFHHHEDTLYVTRLQYLWCSSLLQYSIGNFLLHLQTLVWFITWIWPVTYQFNMKRIFVDHVKQVHQSKATTETVMPRCDSQSMPLFILFVPFVFNILLAQHLPDIHDHQAVLLNYCKCLHCFFFAYFAM